MATASGSSVLGLQTLINGASATQKQFSIAIQSNPIPPARTMGYFWLYAVTPSSPFQSYVLNRGVLSSPGLWQIWTPPASSPGQLFRIDVDWSVAGKNWLVTIL